MTMTTHMAISKPVPVRELHQFGNTLLGAPTDVKWSDEVSRWNDGTRRLGNELDQGLPGIWWIYYRPDSPLRAEDDEDGPACAVECFIDTAYGYRADNDAGCGDLHAWFVTAIAAWCARFGATVTWNAGEVTDDFQPVSKIGLLGDPERGQPAGAFQ